MRARFPPLCPSYDYDRGVDASAPALNLSRFNLSPEDWDTIWRQSLRCHKDHDAELVIAPYIEDKTDTRELGFAIQRVVASPTQPEIYLNVLLHFRRGDTIIPQLIYEDGYGPPPPTDESPSSFLLARCLSDPEHFIFMDYFPFKDEPGALTDCSRLLGYLIEQFNVVFPASYSGNNWKFDPNLTTNTPATQATLYKAFYDCYATQAQSTTENISAIRKSVVNNKTLIGYATRCAGIIASSVDTLQEELDRYSQGESIDAALECYESYLETPLAVSYRSYHSSLTLLQYILQKPSNTEEDPTQAIAFVVRAAIQSYETFTQVNK